MLLATSIALVGENFYVARLVLAGIGTLACLAVYLLGRELIDERTGLIAAGIAAVVPNFVGFSVLILSETLFAACLVLNLFVTAKWIKGVACGASSRTSLRWAFLAGATVALACYVRPSWLLAGPIFVASIATVSRKKKQALTSGLALILGMILTLAPWAIRNYFVTDGRIVITTLWLGPSLYDGFSQEATGESNMQFFDRDHLLDSMTEYEVNRYYSHKAISYALSHPGRSCELAWAKLGRYWKPWPNAAQFRSSWQIAVVSSFFLFLLAFSVFGLWRMRQQPWIGFLTVGPILYFSLIHVVFVGSLRYRLPAEYPLCVICAVGLQSWLSRRRVSKE